MKNFTIDKKDLANQLAITINCYLETNKIIHPMPNRLSVFFKTGCYHGQKGIDKANEIKTFLQNENLSFMEIFEKIFDPLWSPNSTLKKDLTTTIINSCLPPYQGIELYNKINIMLDNACADFNGITQKHLDNLRYSIILSSLKEIVSSVEELQQIQSF